MFCYWLFTLNNPEDVDVPVKWLPKPVWCRWQLEKGESGTPHLQGVVHVKRCRLSAMKKLDGRCHWESTRSKAAEDYVCKEESRVSGPFEFGKKVKQGQRNDLDAMRLVLKKQRCLPWKSHFGATCRYQRSFQMYLGSLYSVRSSKPKVIVYYGTTGVGKSYKANEGNPGAYWKSVTNKWWDGYTQQSVVILDDYGHGEKNMFPYVYLLSLLDAYPFQVEVKGACINFNSATIIITSPRHPSEWYSSGIETIEFDWSELERRIDGIECVYEVRRGFFNKS